MPVWSNQFPINTVPGISGLPIRRSRLPNPAELAAYTSLLPTDVVVFFSVAPHEIRLGMMVKIENTTNLFYNGTYRVTTRNRDGNDSDRHYLRGR